VSTALLSFQGEHALTFIRQTHDMLHDWSCIQGMGVEARQRRHVGTILVDRILNEEPKRNIDATLHMG